MKKFNLRGVLDNLRSSVSTPSKAEWDVEETLRSDHFQVAKTVRHGFPHQPTCLTFDPVQNLLAIGTRSGSVRIFGRPGVDCHMKHDGEVAVIQILFLVNEGAMVTACTDDQLHLWTLRQKKPEIVHSLKFQRERITCAHLPFRSKWLYVGTERGNVHVVNIESFILSGYVINWNKAIELSRKTHPGQVIHLSDNPADPNKLLIGFEGGTIVLWDLKTKTADMRYNCPEVLRSISWHHEGKQFMCSHGDGSLTTWNTRIAQKPQAIMMPHAKIGKDGKPEPCKPIPKVQWLCTKNGESYVIFSGGMPMDKAGRTPTLTVMHAKSTTVLEMEHHVVDFLTLNDSPWNNDFQDPYGIVVLLQNDLVVVDLNCPGYPCFENPYPMDLHESPVTACLYVADCAPDLIPAFYSVGSKQKKTGFSEREWPIKGGQWGQTTCSYSEIMITGHADGSLKFWDASAVTLQVLYKLKTAKIFDKAKCQQPDAEDDPFAIQQLYLDPESRYLISVGLTHFVLFKFSKQEAILDPSVLEISIVYEIYDELESPELEYPPAPPNKPSLSSVSQQSGSLGSYSSSASDANTKVSVRPNTSVRVKGGTRKWSAGYQPELCCILTWIDGDAPPPITNITLNSSYGLLAFGNECGLAVVDIIQKTCLLNLGTPDLYGSMDPYSRAPRSPKNKGQCASLGMQLTPNDVTASDECKSPTTDQVCKSPNSALESAPLLDKSDGSFCRSRSSSMSSLENISKEAIECLQFADSYTRKTDSWTCPCLWVGTSLGSVLVISLNLPEGADDRRIQPVIVSPSGTIFRLKGSILALSFLDCNGFLIPSATEQWQEPGQQSMSGGMKARMSPTSSTEIPGDRQFAIMCSEKHARVVSLPTQACAYKVKITDTSIVAKAEVTTIRDSVCLACYLANGHIMTFSLPSLKPLLDVDFLPSTDVRIAKTFCFSNNGHALYFCSPSEVQKITLSAEICDTLSEMLGELFLPCDTPEAPKQSFFKNLFGPSSNTLDREELFGEEGSGKASKTIAKYTAGMANAQERAAAGCSEIAKAKMLALERGEKLGELEDRTAQMRLEAEAYSQTSHQLMAKFRDKKWYQF
ncbi:hypothetical protein CAPTEDRAFT_91323 [Capitella teleta]|uniref:V-SNARE coiled-coil homology domain-containing protein n=1 Tax=Capitella teleta TaxID=283909 RepID=R7UCB4_CAPTE|nr:hypothetical protein CAPTEDRAFT_91323 [Capitella teleta]|eukprot:ELU03639.1 hypothetical protein CAPTEDRAFT_91323 [Capitella teleta]